jgi:UDPglucose 6-dehydrogenase
MNVTVIGTGFVGVVTAAVLSSFKNKVIGLDIDEKKVKSLGEGKVPFFEPQLEDLLKESLASGDLIFTTNYEKAVSESDVIMVAVGTPSAPDGTADLTYVRAACEALAPHLKKGAIVCIKSTVPPGTLDMLDKRIRPLAKNEYVLASVPEFLREGSAVADTLKPDRVVIGCLDEAGKAVLAQLHAPFHAPILFVSPESAQMGKYSGNAYLATRITFINQIADLCEENGADIQEVIQIIGHDKRIGSHYWYPGLGYGGSCFPKDVKELAAYSRTVGHGNNLFNKIHELNDSRVYSKLDQFAQYLGGWSGKKVAVLGLSFKPHTDDLREAPSTRVIPHLLHAGAKVTAFDPMAVPAAERFFGEQKGLSFGKDLEATIKGVDVVMVLVEWPEFTAYDFTAIQAPSDRWFIDARNQFSRPSLETAGWQYLGIGRGE